MNNDSGLIERRTFLKTGASGGLIAAAFPLLDFTAGFPDVVNSSGRDSQNNVETRGELRRIIRIYGGEFGEAGKEY